MAPLLSTPSKTPFVLLLIFFIISTHGDALFTPTYIDYMCVDAALDFTQTNKLSTSSLLSDLVAKSISNTFSHSSSSLGGKTTYGLFYCSGYVSSQDCHTCVQTAATTITNYCSSYYKTAMIVYKECTLRYSNKTVYATEDESIIVWYYSLLYVDYYTGFNDTLYSTLNTAISQAESSGYATSDAKLAGTTTRISTLAQCTPDILGSPCRACLEAALQKMPYCCNTSISTSWDPQRDNIFTFLPSCQLRYTTNKLLYSSSPGTPTFVYSSSSGKNVWQVMISILALAAAAIVLQ